MNSTLETEIIERNDKLKDFIYDLAERNISEIIDKEIENLKEIYKPLINTKGKYRHQYSLIFTYLVEIKNESKGVCTLEVLSENLSYLYKRLTDDKENSRINDEFYNSFVKLYDHLNLEISRISYSEKLVYENAGKVEERVKDTRKEISKMTKETDGTSKKIEDLSKEIDSMTFEINESKNQLLGIQKDYVSILGIFASIVLAFNGALSFGSNMISNIAQASIYRLIFIGSLIGFVFNSSICLLANLVKKVWNKLDTIDRIYKNTNIILILIMVADAIVYFLVKLT